MNRIKNQLIFLLKVATLFLILFIAAFVFLKIPPFAQDPRYHDFADRRSFFHIPHFFNVVSNLLFLIAGAAGFSFFMRRPSLFATQGERTLALLFAMSLILIGIGSSLFH